MKALKNKLKKLRIHKGDIIIAHHSLVGAFEEIEIPGVDFSVPIVFTDNVRNIKTISKEALTKALEEVKK